MKRILFNASTNFKGGCVQTAVNFIRQNFLASDGEIHWYYAVSSKIYQELLALNTSLPQSCIFPISPARSFNARNRLSSYTKEVEPDIVFTMSGPAYVVFDRPHVLGCTNPFITHINRLAFESLGSKVRKILFRLDALYKRKWYACADYWVFQTDVSRDGFVDKLNVAKEKTTVIPNACSDLYLKAGLTTGTRESDLYCCRILVPSSFYKHKCLEMVPLVAKEMLCVLENEKAPFKFVFTLPEKDYVRIQTIATSLSVLEHVENNGPFLVSEGPALYEKCNLMFLPTLLETFSASYLESMAMGLPIVTTDLDFARDVCGDAAMYFTPSSADEAAKALVSLIQSSGLRANMVQLGKQRLKHYPTITERHQAFVDFLLSLPIDHAFRADFA